MSQENVSKIPCTVGILTYNSEAYLERALQSVREFAEVILADGGSTDDTVLIAERFGARVIQQSNPGHPIRDFALERNRLLDVAQYDWFLYIDSDEAISPELVEAVRRITVQKELSHLFYRVRWQYTDGVMQTMYRSFRDQYQIRLFNRTSGVRFEKSIHERVRPDLTRFTVGTLQESWYTPLDVYLDFSVFKTKVRRNARITLEWSSRNPFLFFTRCILPGSVASGKWVVKNMYVRLKYPWHECIPMRYEWYKLYEIWYIMVAYLVQYATLFTWKGKK